MLLLRDSFQQSRMLLFFGTRTALLPRERAKFLPQHLYIDDVLALFEVLKAMDDEREDLGSYVNLFGYNPKYGVSGRRIVGVRYEPQSFSKGLTRPEQTLPARVARR